MDKPHILVIDDNRDDRELAAIALRREFPDVVIFEANDHQSFQEQLDDSVHVVITDYQLRWTTGQQILAETLQKYPEMPVIMFTNTGTEEVCARAMKSGLFDYIVKKPHHYVKLPAAVRAALTHAATKRKLAEQQEENRRHRLSLQQSLHREQELNETLEARVRERTVLAEQRAMELHRLARELTQAENRERRRLAEVLHEQLQQELFGAQLQLKAIHETAETKTANRLTEVAATLDKVIETSRNLAVDLTPPALYQLGLAAAIEGLAPRFREQFDLVVDVEADEAANPTDDSTCAFLYHAVRELLLNVKKHAGVSSASVKMMCDHCQGRPGTRLEVNDSGCGFPWDDFRAGESAGDFFGLFSIEQRLKVMAGNFTLQSRQGNGTRVILWIPRENATHMAPPAAS